MRKFSKFIKRLYKFATDVENLPISKIWYLFLIFSYPVLFRNYGNFPNRRFKVSYKLNSNSTY